MKKLLIFTIVLVALSGCHESLEDRTRNQRIYREELPYSYGQFHAHGQYHIRQIVSHSELLLHIMRQGGRYRNHKQAERRTAKNAAKESESIHPTESLQAGRL